MAKKNSEQDFQAALSEMMELLSPEERAVIEQVTGQSEMKNGNKTPVLKVNYQERKDINGKRIAKGNFVIGQRSAVRDGKEILEEAGTDLGDSLEINILKAGSQYSYWSKDPKQRCSSQIILERSEKPIGYNLKKVCNDKSCPRRQDGIDRNDKCINQYVVFVRLPKGTELPDGTDCPVAMMYVKGTNYMPFQDYTKGLTAAKVPSFAVKTVVSTEEEYSGSTLFFVLQFKRGAADTENFRENFEIASGVSKDLIAYKEQQNAKLLEGPKGGGVTGGVTGEVMPEGSTAGDDAMPASGDDDMDWGE